MINFAYLINDIYICNNKPIISINMNKLFSQLLPVLAIFLLCSCGDDKEEPESPLQTAAKVQDTLYKELQNTIVGHWVGAEHFNRGEYNIREMGWEDISYISWDQEYIFNADGTGVDISGAHSYDITWRLEKNPEFIRENWAASSCPEVYIIFTYTSIELPPTDKAIWLDGDNHEFLRLTYAPLGGIPSVITSGGEVGIRYKKI